MGGVDASAGFAYQHSRAVQMALTSPQTLNEQHQEPFALCEEAR